MYPRRREKPVVLESATSPGPQRKSFGHGAAPREPSRPIALYASARSRLPPFAEQRGARIDRRTSRRVHRYLDMTVAVAVLLGVLVASNAGNLPKGVGGFLAIRVTIKNVLLLAVFALSWVGSFAAIGLYEATITRSTRSEVLRIFVACSIGSMAVLLFPLMTHGHGALNYGDVALFWGLSFIAAFALRLGVRATDRAIRQRTTTRVIIIGTGPRAMELARQLRADKFTRNEIVGFVDTRDAAAFGSEKDWNLGFLDELEQTLMQAVVDEVLIALPIKSCYNEIEKAIRACEHAGVQSKYLADVFDPFLARPRMEVSGNFPLMAMKVVHDDYRLLIKRGIDLVGITLGLPALIPLGIAIALAVKLSGVGPVFFSQERYGRHKRRFKMYKFRTMVSGAEALQPKLELLNEATGPVFKIKDDPRVTRIGRILRKTSLDELPQIINVLLGDMSLVGPRPLAVRDVGLFAESWLMRRFSVRPGLTCLWQISGRSDLCFEKWIALDLEYIDRWSLLLDMKILARTVPVVLAGSGAM